MERALHILNGDQALKLRDLLTCTAGRYTVPEK